MSENNLEQLRKAGFGGVVRMGFTVDDRYYVGVCTLRQYLNNDLDYPVYKDGNRLGKRKAYDVLKRRSKVIQDRVNKLESDIGEFMSSEDLDRLIEQRIGEEK
jgi:hypothetical protein